MQQDNVFVQLHCSIQYRVIKENADDAFYELQNPEEQIQAYVFDGEQLIFSLHILHYLSYAFLCWFCLMSTLFWLVVRAHVPRMTLDEVFEQKSDVAQAVSEELEKVN